MISYRFTVLLLLALVATACGGTAPADTAAKPEGPETRWLRGLAAADVGKAVTARSLTCRGPEREGGTNVWTCGAETPLVAYRVRYYGSAPLKIEYVTGTITQSGTPRIEVIEPLFVTLAGLHFEGSDAPAARQWVVKAIADGGGDTTYGAAKFRVRGHPGNLTLDIKASGSEW